MTDKSKLNITFALDFARDMPQTEIARRILDAFERDNGFAALAATLPVTASLGLRFANAAARDYAFSQVAPVPLSAPDGLALYEVEDINDSTSAFMMQGTLEACLNATAKTLQGLGVGMDLAKNFEDANKGQKILPEITAFYQWMDAKVNSRLQSPAAL